MTDEMATTPDTRPVVEIIADTLMALHRRDPIEPTTAIRQARRIEKALDAAGKLKEDPMTTTPNPTAEQIVAEGMHDLTYRGKQVTPSHARALADYGVSRLRAVGLLGGDLTEAHTHRPEQILAYVETDCAICNCEHESECPMREVLICSECTRIAETASPGWLERTFDFSLVKWPCAAAGVAPQEPSPVASTPTVSDDSGHGGDDDRGGREDGPEDEGRSHQATVAGTPQRPSKCAECHRASGHKMDCSHRRAPSNDHEKRRVEVSNEIAGIVFNQVKRVWPDLHPVLDLRHGIADAVIAEFPALLQEIPDAR